MTVQPSPGSAVPASGEGWTVVVDMPLWEQGKDRGRPVGWLNLNESIHPLRASKVSQAWRKAAWAALKRHRLPTGLDRVQVLVELRFTDARDRDASNHQRAIKPCIDALQTHRVDRRVKKNGKTEDVTHWGVGLIPNDTKRHIDQPEPLIGPPIRRKRGAHGHLTGPAGQIILHITPLPSFPNEQGKP